LAEIRRHPKSGSLRIPLGEAYRGRGNLVAARAVVEEGLRLGLSGADSIRAVTILADIAFRQGRPNEARTRLTTLAARGGAGADLLAMLAQLRWDDHQREEAIALGMEAVARDPQNVERLRWTAERWKEFGRPDEALVLRKRILVHPQATEEDIFQVGFLSHQLGDGQTAIDTYLKLLARRPTHPQGNYNLSLLMLSLGDTLDAARRLELAIQGDPEMQRAYFELAVLYLHAGRLTDARRVFILFQAAAGADSVLNAEVEMILEGLMHQKDRPRPGR
jgi:tetratricopeptide (TPR) repeat protein